MVGRMQNVKLVSPIILNSNLEVMTGNVTVGKVSQLACIRSYFGYSFTTISITTASSSILLVKSGSKVTA